jgi:surface antigen
MGISARLRARSKFGAVLGAAALAATALGIGIGVVPLTAPAAAAPSGSVHSLPGPGVQGVTMVCDRNPGYACTTAGYSGQSTGWWGPRYGNGQASANSYGLHNCTLYAAYRAAQNGLADPGWSAMARDWDTSAAAAGTRVDQTPGLGSIAQWNGSYGHVAYVEAVTTSYIEISADNYHSNVTDRMRIDRSSPAWPDNFIHLKDISAPSATSIVSYPDGRLEIWGVDTQIPDGQNNVFHKWQTRAGGGWSNWMPEAGYLTSIAGAMNSDGRLELWGVNAHAPEGQSNVWSKWQNKPGADWSAWTGHGGHLTSLSIARNADKRLEVWGVNANLPDGQNNVFNTWQTAPSSGWSALSPQLGHFTQLSMVRNPDGRMEVWGVNANTSLGQGNVYNIWQNKPGASWSAWSFVGGHMTDLSAVTNPDGRLEVWGVNAHAGGTDVYNKWQNKPGASWSGWSPVDGHFTAVNLVVNPDGRLEVWALNAQDTDSQNVFNKWQNKPGANWSGWSPVAGRLTA